MDENARKARVRIALAGMTRAEIEYVSNRTRTRAAAAMSDLKRMPLESLRLLGVNYYKLTLEDIEKVIGPLK
jgi:hypothetical protein